MHPVSERVVLRPARHIIGQFGEESFQAITCPGADKGILCSSFASPDDLDLEISK